MRKNYGFRKKTGHFDWVIDESMFLSTREVKKLKTAAKRKAHSAVGFRAGVAARDWFLIDLGLSSGLRVQEIADLVCGDVFISDGKSSLVVRRGKGGKKRVVRFSPDFRERARDYIKWKQSNGEPIGPDSPLFRSTRTGGHMSTRALQRAFKRSARLAGLSSHYSIHSLRHTYATALLKASRNNVRLVQKMLGHSSIRVTEAYLGVASNDVDRALIRLYRA